MSNLIRWEPAREIVSLREAMERLFNDPFSQPFGLADGWQVLDVPALDMYQTDEEVVVKAALPGVKAEQVQINVTGDVLTIHGENQAEDEAEHKTYQIREQRWGAFERSVTLPTSVVPDKARAEFEDGVLTVSLPKADEVKPRTIAVKAK
jgi:HSP20 family protein